MRHDYAKRPVHQPKRGRFAVLVVMLVVGAVITFTLIYHFRYRATVCSKSSAMKNINIQQTKSHATSVVTKPSEFDFYTLLPRMMVTKMQVQRQSNSYLLRLTTSGSLRQARRLQAKLVAQNYRVNIRIVRTQQGKKYYQLLIGPYVTLRQAEAAQSTLQRHGIDSVVLQK